MSLIPIDKVDFKKELCYRLNHTKKIGIRGNWNGARFSYVI